MKRKMLLPALLSVVLIFSLILPASAAGASATVPRPDDRSISHWAVDSSSAASAMALNTPEGEVTPMVAAGSYHTVGLKSDGTVVAVGDNDIGQCDVGGWTDITHVAASGSHTVGVKSDGTVVAVGWNEDGQCDVGGWTDIIQVAASGWAWGHTVGLKADGTVVTVGDNEYGQCYVGGWMDIVQVVTGRYHTVGVKSDGTVVAVGSNSYGRCDVGNWTDIIRVAAGNGHTVGLKADGTVVAVGDNQREQCDVGGWTDTVQVAASGEHTVGLKSDGAVVAVGSNYYGQCNVGGWNLVLAVPPSQEVQVGVKAGDWIKIKYTINGWPAGVKRLDWLKLEFLSVTGTKPYVRATIRTPGGTEDSDTMSLDLVAGRSEVFGLSGFVIPANLTTGDYVYITEFGYVAIEGETNRTYAGASRTVVYASISQDEAQYTYHWDKLTGVMVEVSVMTSTIKATETNMWEATTVGMSWWPWIIVAVAAAVGLVVFFVRRRGRRTRGPA